MRVIQQKTLKNSSVLQNCLYLQKKDMEFTNRKHTDREEVDFNYKGLDITLDLDIELGLNSQGDLIIDTFEVLNASKWCDRINDTIEIEFTPEEVSEIQSAWEAKFKSDAEYDLEQDLREYEPMDCED